MPQFFQNCGRGDIRGRPAGRLSFFLGCARGATGLGFRFLRKATDNATAFADAAVIVCAIGQIPSLQPTLFSNRLRKPATGSFAAEMDRRSARPFSLLRKRNRKMKTR